MQDKNQFMLLRDTVNKAVAQYDDIREKIAWPDKGKSATIHRLARPFQTGYFTIAVAGKTSSGKSTFINSLIGEELLPTGHNQTTSALTWIVSSDERYLEATFADGTTKRFTENLAEELCKIVAVAPEFEDLPTYHINNLIKADLPISEILERKEGIEEQTLTATDENLWRKYVASTPKSKIAENVVIHLPLPAEYEGWRIVDTPGVGAVGGIQDVTKKLLTDKDEEYGTNVVDAVVLLHKGSDNIQDEGVIKFAQDLQTSLGDLAKGRLFFVLTHAGHIDFISHIDEILPKAKSLFGERMEIPAERITYIDSFIHRFVNDAKKSKRDFSHMGALSTPLAGWSEADWKKIRSVLSTYYCELQMAGKEATNDTLFFEMENLSRFHVLSDILYEFLNDEKSKSFEKLFKLIESDLEVFKSVLDENIQTVSMGKDAITHKIKVKEEERTRLYQALGKVQQKATPAAIKKEFKFACEELLKIRHLSSIDAVRTRYLEIIKKGEITEKNFFQGLKEDFSSFNTDHFSEQSVTLERLDFDEIEHIAGKKSEEEIEDRSKDPIKGELPKLKWFSSPAKYAPSVYPKKKVENKEMKLREFKAIVLEKGRNYIEAYIRTLESKVKFFFEMVASDINEKTNTAIKELEKYTNDLTDKKGRLDNLKTKRTLVEKALADLKQLED